MSKEKKEKKKVIIPTDEFGQIKLIISDALTRIISGKTKRTYHQELIFISNIIQKYIKTSYVTKLEHKEDVLKQVFGHVNQLTDLLDKSSVQEIQGIRLSIKELEKNIYK